MDNDSNEEAKIIRDMVRHEDDLLNQRITWFSTIQGLLFAALALVWDKASSSSLVLTLSLIGVILSASTFYALQRGLEAIRIQIEWWDKNKATNYAGPDVIGRRPGLKSKNWLWPYFLFPVVFITAWTFILIWRMVFT
jgi:hypothetical protein